MDIEDPIPLLEGILQGWTAELGGDFAGYRNHVYRVAHYCFALHDGDANDRRKIIIAACFHDLGIWSAHTVDYLAPSAALATEYLRRNGLESWCDEIALMIETHHKLRAHREPGQPLVEVLRKADLIDVSLGLARFGVPRSYIGGLKRQFPNAGFHIGLVRRLAGWFVKHPLRPAPFLKW